MLLQIENIDTLCCCKLKIFIPCVATTSMIRQNMYDIQILWLIGLISELKIGIVFQHTATVKELVYEIYFHFECNFYHTRTEKVHLSEDVNSMLLISISGLA